MTSSAGTTRGKPSSELPLRGRRGKGGVWGAPSKAGMSPPHAWLTMISVCEGQARLGARVGVGRGAGGKQGAAAGSSGNFSGWTIFMASILRMTCGPFRQDIRRPGQPLPTSGPGSAGIRLSAVRLDFRVGEGVGGGRGGREGAASWSCQAWWGRRMPLGLLGAAGESWGVRPPPSGHSGFSGPVLGGGGRGGGGGGRRGQGGVEECPGLEV